MTEHDRVRDTPRLRPRPIAGLPSLAWLLLSWLLLAGCAASPCPTDADGLRNPALRAFIGADMAAGTAIVNRFVDSPDLEFRGYDVEITSAVAGLGAADQVMFVSVPDPMPGIELGADVLVVGHRGPQPLEIRPAGCPVLVPLDP